MPSIQGLGQIVLFLGVGLIIVNLLIGFNDPNPTPTNIGGNIRKVVTGK